MEKLSTVACKWQPPSTYFTPRFFFTPHFFPKFIPHLFLPNSHQSTISGVVWLREKKCGASWYQVNWNWKRSEISNLRRKSYVLYLLLGEYKKNSMHLLSL